MYYKVKVYKIEDKISKSEFYIPKFIDDRCRYEYVDDIIIERYRDNNRYCYREVYTEEKIDTKSYYDVSNGLLVDDAVDYSKLREEKINFFTFIEDINDRSIPTNLEIDEYFNTFFEGKFKRIVDNIGRNKQKIK